MAVRAPSGGCPGRRSSRGAYRPRDPLRCRPATPPSEGRDGCDARPAPAPRASPRRPPRVRRPRNRGCGSPGRSRPPRRARAGWARRAARAASGRRSRSGPAPRRRCRRAAPTPAHPRPRGCTPPPAPPRRAPAPRIAAGGRPQRELPARGVPDRGNAVAQVEPSVVEAREVVDRGRDVVEGRRPAASLPAPDAPVLHVPGGDPAPGEVHARGLHHPLRVPRSPVAAVQHDHHRWGPGPSAGGGPRAPSGGPRSGALRLGEEVEQDAGGRWHARTLKAGYPARFVRPAIALALVAARARRACHPRASPQPLRHPACWRACRPRASPPSRSSRPTARSTSAASPMPQGNNTAPRKVFAYARRPAQARVHDHRPDAGRLNGVQVAAIDAKGRLYLLDQHPARVDRLDPATGEQDDLRDVPGRRAVPRPVPTGDCSATTTDNEPEPDYAAWGTDGSIYVTDYTQGLIWRVPPHGGAAKVWLTDPLFDGAQFGPAGIVLMPDHKTLMVSTSAGWRRHAWRLDHRQALHDPDRRRRQAGRAEEAVGERPARGPDGFALAASGNIYLALVGPGANQIVEISPNGQELARFPGSPDDERPDGGAVRRALERRVRRQPDDRDQRLLLLRRPEPHGDLRRLRRGAGRAGVRAGRDAALAGRREVEEALLAGRCPRAP